MDFQSESRNKVEATKENLFVEACLNEFIEPSVITGNRQKIKNLLSWSYLPNFISITTAGFFIVYLLQDYSILIRVFLVTLLLIVAASIEYGKRALINESGKIYFLTDKIKIGLFAGAVTLVIISMTVSFIGGNKLITTTAKTPDKVTNPKIDSLNTMLSAEMETIKRLQSTTWKGVITRAANKGINQSKSIQSGLIAQISELEANDNGVHEIKLNENANKIKNFGYVLGVVAILADLVLFFMLWTIKKLKHEIILLHLPTPTPSATIRSNQAQNIGFSHNSIQPTEQPTTMRPTMGFKMNPRNERAMNGKEDPSKKTRVCDHCGEDFEMRTTWQRFCSKKCNHEFHKFALK